jgi:hypothetical protein
MFYRELEEVVLLFQKKDTKYFIFYILYIYIYKL